jgi:hypothetical protein
MPTTYISDATLKTAVAESIGQLSAELATRWDGLIAQANIDAYYFILRKLGERGYTKVQIDAWPEAATFNRKIGLLFVLEEGGVLSTFSDTFIRAIDRRKELDTALLSDASGNFVYPSGSGQECIVDKMDYTGYDFNPAVEFTFTQDMREQPSRGMDGGI